MEGSNVKYSSIGWAVGLLLYNHRVRRRSWRNIVWVQYVPAGAVQVPEKFGGGNTTGPFLVAKTVNSDLVPWNASAADLLADDWEMVDATAPGEYHLSQSQTG